MRYRLFGNTGLRVSELCLGTMTFGEDADWGAPKEDSKAMYRAFRDAGGNFVDTANVYTNGTSETYLGEFTKGHRNEIVLASKYSSSAPGTDPNSGGNQRKNMMRSCEATLKRLKTDYLDLYWMHAWDQMTPVEEVMRAFDDLVRQGKILHCGVSDAPAWWVAQANTFSELRARSPFVGLQIEYNLIERTVERELVPAAAALGMTVTAWSPLAGGVLTGKYVAGEGSGGRFDNEEMKQFVAGGERPKRVVETVQQVAEEVGRSPAQVALAWLRQRPTDVVPIIGARKPKHLEDNLGCLDLTLSEEQLLRLDDASAIELGFPHDFLAKDHVQNLVFGGLRDRIDA